MDSFFIGLQFLTRIHIVKQTVWTEESFGKSVRYFPLVGLVLGLLYGACCIVPVLLAEHFGWLLPYHLMAAVLAVLPFLATGGIHCDGLMDTVDGIFSGRDRDRMLEIMKDSRSGSFGVVAFAILLLVQYAVLMDLPMTIVPSAMLAMPIIGRLMMVFGICLFPYARPEGMGKAFSEYGTKKCFAGVFCYTLVILCLIGWKALVAAGVAFLFSWLFGQHVTRLLGGLTGDVYGAICTVSELLVLMVYLVIFSLGY